MVNSPPTLFYLTNSFHTLRLLLLLFSFLTPTLPKPLHLSFEKKNSIFSQLTQKMSMVSGLFFIPIMVQSSILGFEAFACALFFIAVFALWLAPGGLAWALCKVRACNPISGPSGYPLIGSVTIFTGSTPHRVLAKLARSLKAEPLLSLSVGLTRFVISSQPETAKEVLNSSAFANRPRNETAYELLFNRAMGFAPYREYWRNLRRIAATHLFSPKRIVGSESFRLEMGMKMVEEIRALMAENGDVEVKKGLHFGSLNNVMKTVFGKCYEFGDEGGDEGGDGLELEGLVREGYELLGIFNWSNHFPFLGWLDFQGVRKRARGLVSEVEAFVGKIIEEHRMKRVKGESFDKDCTRDFVDVLLDLEKDHKLSDSDMVAVLWSGFLRGWFCTLKFNPKPKVRSTLLLAHQGLFRVLIFPTCLTSKPLSKSLNFRVHPPGPLLSWARIAIHDIYVGESFVPAGTTAMVNMWSITHDKNVWSEPEKFKSERFMESSEDVNIMGSDLRLAPFGSGRRVCPGKALGLDTVQLWLAQLLQSFSWVESENVGVDLGECLKLSMEMKSPLVCKAVARVV